MMSVAVASGTEGIGPSSMSKSSSGGDYHTQMSPLLRCVIKHQIKLMLLPPIPAILFGEHTQ
jgi:hypothetical protein